MVYGLYFQLFLADLPTQQSSLLHQLDLQYAPEVHSSDVLKSQGLYNLILWEQPANAIKRQIKLFGEKSDNTHYCKIDVADTKSRMIAIITVSVHDTWTS